MSKKTEVIKRVVIAIDPDGLHVAITKDKQIESDGESFTIQGQPYAGTKNDIASIIELLRKTDLAHAN